MAETIRADLRTASVSSRTGRNTLMPPVCPYPWPRFGYTYDWGNPEKSIGLSEFVIHGKKADGSEVSVGIKAVTPTAAYFTN
ncbi:MAG: hypothetical protein NTW71_12160 [Deltaproteobacteria bacterium]|nr:hypothetical protein [Deltaproteobacteria bacterium]